MPKTILSEVPHQLKGRGHNRCIPMSCGNCAGTFLFPLSDGTETQIETMDQIDIRCPVCLDITAEPAAPLRETANIHNGQSGMPA